MDANAQTAPSSTTHASVSIGKRKRRSKSAWSLEDIPISWRGAFDNVASPSSADRPPQRARTDAKQHCFACQRKVNSDFYRYLPSVPIDRTRWLTSLGIPRGQHAQYMTGRRRVCGLHWPTGSDRLTDLPSLNLNGVKWTAATPTRRPVEPEVAERTRQQLEAATEEQRRAAVEAKLVVKLAAERKAQAELEEAQLAFLSSPAGAAFREEQNRLRFKVAQLEASLTQNLDAVRLAKKRKILLLLLRHVPRQRILRLRRLLPR
mmetsp:Transcript_15106/g.45255  ORF Transcript_15106/g.45255 Transcript_15106/m.45255 type:complete len:262 (-) Transcript_15106:1404-2189(-)